LTTAANGVAKIADAEYGIVKINVAKRYDQLMNMDATTKIEHCVPFCEVHHLQKMSRPQKFTLFQKKTTGNSFEDLHRQRS
jgi:hypothetical protein